MKNYIYVLAGALLSCLPAYSEEEPTPTKLIEPQHHRLYAGTDVFWTRQKRTATYRGYRINCTYNAVFGGVRLGYDYLKPHAFYFGMDGLASMGKSSIKLRYRYFDDAWTQKIEKTPLFANIEQRYGYTFQDLISTNSTFIPFVGVDWYYIRPQFDISHSYSSRFYSAAGLRASQKFREIFDLGLNLKAMYAFAGISENFWGYEVALPFTWHVGASKKWDLQFQPYLLQLNASTNDYFWGARLEAGYSF